MPRERSENFFTELLKFILIAAAIVFPIRLFVAQPFIVSGASMSPTFNNGQYLIVDELSYRLQDPNRGDVIIFRYPKNPKEFFIKRIIGLPTETVSINGNTITITKADGKTVALSEPYVTKHGNGSARSYQLKVDEYFVMGDNRPESSDSRVWGTLPRDNIVGKAFMRLLPLNSIGFFPGSLPTVEEGTFVQ
ncbi:signal peptidase I [Candidatus Adlerbacteria bacterium RIFCSPHIGHO2_02_FULL_52_17]|uniref:Signal peptidase I n=1 Tax=Candidatus Adlerbacteria bacterium RIFCSPHIGHO2_02_FULL_52_17 TaxID=1797240 RepID=A0A1F4XN30_9BACT|nr:MAG: signal peptidase I [Candidatus Adlerbacteria bacterium RIFCSPHIGHO2_02_FULL_52_17]